MSEIHCSHVKLLHTVSYENKPQSLKFADCALYFASAALGYEDLTLNGFEGKPQWQAASKVDNVFLRFLCGLAAVVILPATLIGLVIKWCLKEKQTEQITKAAAKMLPMQNNNLKLIPAPSTQTSHCIAILEKEEALSAPAQPKKVIAPQAQAQRMPLVPMPVTELEFQSLMKDSLKAYETGEKLNDILARAAALLSREIPDPQLKAKIAEFRENVAMAVEELVSQKDVKKAARVEVNDFYERAERMIQQGMGDFLPGPVGHLMEEVAFAREIFFEDSLQSPGLTRFSSIDEFLTFLENSPGLVLHRLYLSKNPEAARDEIRGLRRAGQEKFAAGSLSRKMNLFYKKMWLAPLSQEQAQEKLAFYLKNVPGAKEHLIADWRELHLTDLSTDEQLIANLRTHIRCPKAMEFFRKLAI
jgi:hypothetical protein